MPLLELKPQSKLCVASCPDRTPNPAESEVSVPTLRNAEVCMIREIEEVCAKLRHCPLSSPEPLLGRHIDNLDSRTTTYVPGAVSEDTDT